jgi:hypothetical protein
MSVMIQPSAKPPMIKAAISQCKLIATPEYFR